MEISLKNLGRNLHLGALKDIRNKNGILLLQVVTFIPDAGGSIVINGKCFFIKISLISGISDTKIGLKSGNLFTDFLQYTGNFKRCISV